MAMIDVHVHPSTQEWADCMGGFYEPMEHHYRADLHVRTEDEMAADLRDTERRSVLLAFDAETNTGLPAVSNDYVAGVVARHPDVFVAGFGSVDPWKGKQAVTEAQRCVRELGMKGFKFKPDAQAFYPNDRRFYPLWETLNELETIALFHVGTTGLGVGHPGAGGFKLSYNRPIPYIDDIAADFPKLTIIAAHPAWPWQEEMLAIALHKPNVYMDLSGWSPKYFEPSLKREINGRLQDKVLFGSDYPFITPERWLRDFSVDQFYRDSVVQKVLYVNAAQILKL
jgi:predicted TIM-barrel fold metal-dependent hydrolase